MRLNAAEVDALVRNLDGLTEMYGESYHVELTRRDSLDNQYEDGFVVMRVTLPDDSWYEDAFSETGSTTMWTTSQRQRISELRTEIDEARRLGRDPQRQLCELASIEEEQQ